MNKSKANDGKSTLLEKNWENNLFNSDYSYEN